MLQQQLATLTRKINALRDAFIIETDPARKFQLEEQIREAEALKAKLQQQLQEENQRQSEEEAMVNDDPASLEDRQQAWRMLVTKDTQAALEQLEQALQPSSAHYNTLLLNMASFNSTRQQLLAGTLSQNQAELTFARVRNALLFIIGEIAATDLR